MRRGKWAMVPVVVAVVALSGAAFSLEREGTPLAEWRKKTLPHPSEVSVAVLPFWAAGRTQAEMVRGAVLLNLQRHDFRLAPAGRSLPEIAKATDALVEAEWKIARATDAPVDTERTGEAGVRPDRELAIQVGRKASADWVIYGEVEKLRTDVSHGFFTDRKIGTIEMRLVLTSVSTGEILYWTRLRNTWGSKVYARSAASIERKMAQDAVALIFKGLAEALPPHSVGREVSQDDIAGFVQAMGA